MALLDTRKRQCDVDHAAAIFAEYGSFIRAVIRSQVNSETKADDMFQDFFLSLVCKPVPQNVRNIKGYLYRAITNDIADIIRLTKKYRNCIYEYAKCCNHSHRQEIPENIVMELEEIKRIFELVDKLLPETEAQAVRFQYRDGLDAKEIAEKMSVRNATIRGYVSEGLSRIRRLLKDIGAKVVE